MSDASDYDPVECPVADCEYRDGIRSVAGHVSGADDPDHSWSRLGFDGAREFVMAEKRRQRDGDGAGGVDDADDIDAGPSPRDESAGDDGGDAGDEEPFELGFEREALLAVDLVDEYDAESLDDLDPFQLANLYSLLADLRSSADDARAAVRDALLSKVRDDREVPSDFGSVRRETHERRRLKDEEEVAAAVETADVDPEEVRSFDASKLREAVEESDLDESAVFDVEERTQIRKGSVDDERRRERFERLPDEVRSFAEDR